MSAPTEQLTSKALGVRGPRRELAIAVTGCFMGTVLLLAAVQFFLDASTVIAEREPPKNFFTVNKRVEGGALANLGKNDEGFSPEEITAIETRPEVQGVGVFKRNRFPVEIHIWPAGKVGLGEAAKADVFFETVPDEFIDAKPDNWGWDENSTHVPLIIPKFYLDLWNFGFAPTRVEYPALSSKAALGIPIEIFLGKRREASQNGRFVAFSRRINSILVPESFLEWANAKYAQPDVTEYWFLWLEGAVNGPPRTREQLLTVLDANSSPTAEFSPLKDPAARRPLTALRHEEKKPPSPSRLIVRVDEANTEALLSFLREQGYEINRELPEHDLLNDASKWAFSIVGGIGLLLSLLSVATFSASYRLVVTRAATPVRDLLHLGFSRRIVTSAFIRRFLKLFGTVFGTSLLFTWLLKTALHGQAKSYELSIPTGLSFVTLFAAVLYAGAFVAVNVAVIRDAVRKLG
ncbi:MAG: hypothetical protein HOA16_04630 [Opitutae bacterium]|nr:hypothetical protein [Opitutae bacterium]